MEIGKKLKEARLRSGFTQEQAAEKILVSRQTISNWENEKSLPDIVSVMNMSDLYEISLDELLKGDQKMRKKVEKDANAYRENRRLLLITGILVVLVAAIRLISISIGGVFHDFLEAATPWILGGIGLACACAYLSEKE